MHINIDGKKIDTAEFAEFCELGLMQDGTTVRGDARGAYAAHFDHWLRVSLIAVTESGAYVLTPRGADLRASLPLLKAPAKHETTAKPCSKCHGEGEQPLFVSMETCDRCKGSKVEPRTAAAIIADYAVKLSDQQAYGRVNRGQHTHIFVHDEIVIDCPSEQAVNEAAAQIWESMKLKWKPLPPFQSLPRAAVKVEHPWVLIDSEEVARSFVGKRVEIDAPAGGLYVSAAKAHGQIAVVWAADRLNLDTTAGGIDWPSRRNVRLRAIDGVNS